MFLYKNHFLLIFSSFNPNRVMGINGGHFPASCRVCLRFFFSFLGPPPRFDNKLLHNLELMGWLSFFNDEFQQFFTSRTTIAGAIISLFLLRAYDVTTTSNLFFVHAILFEVRA